MSTYTTNLTYTAKKDYEIQFKCDDKEFFENFNKMIYEFIHKYNGEIVIKEAK